MSREQELIDTLREVTHIQTEYIAMLKEEIARLKTSLSQSAAPIFPGSQQINVPNQNPFIYGPTGTPQFPYGNGTPTPFIDPTPGIGPFVYTTGGGSQTDFNGTVSTTSLPPGSIQSITNTGSNQQNGTSNLVAMNATHRLNDSKAV